jgi:GT2 family glycosyltransferase
MDMLSCFEQNPRLGIAGGRIVDRGQDPAEGRFFSLDSVGCAVQFFRRRCYEQIGGYLPLPIGGEDAAAEIMARMHGWRVRTFPEVQVMHLRSTGQGLGTVWRARYFTGVENYTLGYHPLFFVLKCFKRIRQSPAFIGSFFMLLGYAWAGLKGQPHLLQPGVVAYLRNEQRAKMYSRLLRRSG